MPASAQSTFSSIFSLVCVIFIDALGMAILFPMLSPLFEDRNSALLPLSASIELRHFYYGDTLAIFSFAMFFAAPVLGNISDHLGRKKVLIVSLLGTFFSYVLMALAIPLKSITLFFLGRLFCGLMAGSQPIAQAAIIDISHPENKAHNLSLIMGAMSLGWIAGPLLGGFLSDNSILYWFNPGIALSFAAFLSFLNFIILQLTFKETIRKKKNLTKLHLHKGPSEFILAFMLKDIRLLSVIYLIVQIGWCFYFGYLSLFLTTSRSLSTLSIGFFLTFFAMGFTTPSFGLIKLLSKYLTLEKAAASAMGLGGIVILLTCMVPSHSYLLWPMGFIVGLSVGASFSYLLTLFSNRVALSEQGRIMGITTAIVAVSWVIASLVGGLISNISAACPLIIGGILFLFCSMMTYIYSSQKREMH